ncbi:GMC family oxidoreductase [Aliikangiella sp. G2MR2-5]|uniref:GMC family oxidoreductase n=1 Tax=Aliikangiella sp. G2MR2-5 TaxID=2788943 RepID=UPI0018AA1471|nr:GMC family oxidoreductase [Aliikangiella sp. G2MR2-5]
MKSSPLTTQEFDICVVGSGAGGGPIAYELAKAGYRVAVIEKGGWFDENDFKKDEMLPRRKIFKSKVQQEPHIIEEPDGEGGWDSHSTGQFWGGNIVGGASNFMSGYFHRLKPEDFRLLSEFGPIEGANITDWPISYEDLEPYYTKVEQVVGVSGKVVKHPFLEPRSTSDFPFPPTAEHPIASWFDRAASELGYHPFPMARAVLSRPLNDRKSCEYSGYCGSYGCHSGAKGSSRAALLKQAVETGNVKLITYAKAYHINTNHAGNATSIDYFDRNGSSHRIKAKIFSIACYSIESSRLLLSSTGPKHPDGIGNRYQQIGKNLHCCAGGTGHGIFDLTRLTPSEAESLKVRGPFFNRALQDWYIIDDKKFFGKRVKGGTIDFVFDPPAPTAEVNSLKWDDDDNLLWGSKFKQKLKSHFTQSRDFKFEVFCDWLPTDNCNVSLSANTNDRWGTPAAKVKVGFHPHDLKVAKYIVSKGVEVMKKMGAQEYYGNAFTAPTSNLIAGGLRFGHNPQDSALDADCRVHGTENLFVSDGSFMPNGGSVTPTWTIYANAFRIADKIKQQIASLK